MGSYARYVSAAMSKMRSICLWNADRDFRNMTQNDNKFEEKLLYPVHTKHIIQNYLVLLTIQRTFPTNLWTH